MPHDTRNAFADPAAATLQDVLDQLDTLTTLTQPRRREVASAINATARWLHREPRDIPANHAWLRRAYSGVNPISVGASPRRFNNVRSLVKAALAVGGVPTAGGQYLAPLNAVWKPWADRVPDPYARTCLGRLMRYAGTQDLGPEQVDDAVIQRFHEALTDENLTAKPMIAAQTAVRTWNKMIDAVAGWPGTRLTPLHRRKTHTLPWAALPTDFVTDVDRYLSIVRGDDPTHKLAPPRPLKPLSIKTRRYQILQLVSGFVAQGGHLEELHDLKDLCRVDRVSSALRFFIDRQRQRLGSDTPVKTSMIGGLADAIRGIAKHYVQVPVDQLIELARLAGRLKDRRAGMAEKNRQRLRQIEAPDAQRAMLRYPLDEMRKLHQISQPARPDAVRYSVLLAMEMLIMAPMRVGNLARLDLDLHFVWPARAGQDIGLAISRGDVKNNQPLDYKVPAGSTQALLIYLRRFRPLLCEGSNRALFPGHGDKAKRSDTLSKQITDELRRGLGVAWHPHLFRHLAARINLWGNPGDYEGTRRLLGHRSAETTYRSYEGMEMRPAVDVYDRMIEAVRGTPPIPPAGRRPRKAA